MTLPSLIDKQDTREVIRDQIAKLLLEESAAQQVHAVQAGKPPTKWNLRVFTNRTNPWDLYIASPDNETVDARPIVNIHFENANVDRGASNVVASQTYNGIFNIDVYGYGVASDAPTGHIPGDHMASLEADSALTIVRNILMAAEYTYLGIPDTVDERMAETFDFFRPPIDERGAVQVHAHRMRLNVRYREFAPVATGQPLEEIGVAVSRKETGEVYLNATYDVSTT